MVQKGGDPRLGYQPGLDGLRAVAVLGVIAFHNFSWLPGGYYGVDTFFALSGFLITSLLLTEWQNDGTIALVRFWARRARRLLPALFLLVVVVGVVAAVWPAAFGDVDVVPSAAAAVFYAGNWYFIGGHSTYFGAITQPSPFLHTWSLAIEEQFYLVWPLVVLAVLRFGRRWTYRRRLDGLLVVTIVGTVASAAVMAWLAPIGGTTTRAYYGTDTRAQGLLVGAALAVVLARRATGSLHRRPAIAGAPVTRPTVAGLAVAGLAGTAALWFFVPETSALAFHGGFLLAAVAATAIVAGVIGAPRGPVALALAWRPARALGRISYGVYLWYWPVLLVMTGPRLHAGSWLLFAERLVVTVGIAAISYRLLELPIRRRVVPSWRAIVAAPVAAGLTLATVAVATFVLTSQAPPVSASSLRPVTGPGATKVLLVGDSLAGSLGVGLGEEAAHYDVDLVNEGSPGCSLSMDELFKVLDYTVPPGAPCKTGDPAELLDQWRRWVDEFNPDVVVYLARGELFDQQVDDRWSNIGQAGFDGYLTGRFGQAIDVLRSKGAAVVLLTTPYYDSGDQPDGSPWPEDDPTRVVTDNAIIHDVVRSIGSPSVTSFDLGALTSPGGHFDHDVDGVDVRCSDGVHFTAAAGEWVAPRLLPELVRLGRDHRQSSPGGRWPGMPPPVVPSWWPKLQCTT
jgi:peptidoglycan/LPS O-acetylase OafA/YrhL